MTLEQKELLLKDLCARLPYKVMLNCDNTNDEELWAIDSIGLINHDYYINEVKPYLFPLSSMTEEQKEEYCQLQQKVIYNSKGVVNEDVMEYINWCHKNHLDINDLIPQWLAIDATNLNIY